MFVEISTLPFICAFILQNTLFTDFLGKTPRFCDKNLHNEKFTLIYNIILVNTV
jgi:hypothetical protein